MFQNDYIMRMIEQFTKALAQILFKRQAGETTEAMDELEEAYGSYLGLDRKTVMHMTDDQLLMLFGGESAISSDKCIMLAELFYMEFKLLPETSQENERNHLGLRALHFYLLAMLNTDMWDNSEFREHFEEIIDEIPMAYIRVSLLDKIAEYYARIGEDSNKIRIEKEIWQRLG